MNSRLLVLASSLTNLVLLSSSLPASLTIEQAEQLSKRTGRPILAVAGSKT